MARQSPVPFVPPKNLDEDSEILPTIPCRLRIARQRRGHDGRVPLLAGLVPAIGLLGTACRPILRIRDFP